jgi:hypothetical protein
MSHRPSVATGLPAALPGRDMLPAGPDAGGHAAHPAAAGFARWQPGCQSQEALR